MKFWKTKAVDADGHVHDVPHSLTHAAGPTAADVKHAYERGRRDERARHRGHPIIGLIVFAVALLGAGMLYLAAREGSFSGGGQVVDHKLAVAASKAEDAGANAAVSVADAGQSLKSETLNR